MPKHITDNYNSQPVMQSGVLTVGLRSIWTRGIRGEGQVVQDLDTGCRESQNFFDDNTLRYTVGNVFKYLVVCNYETSEHSWNAFPITNTIGKDAKAPVAKYPYFYQINSLASGLSPRVAATPLAIELSEFSCQTGTEGITLNWQTSSENNNYGWIIQRSEQQDQNYRTLDTLTSEGSYPGGRAYSYLDPGVLPNRTYYYRLADLDIDGQMTWHGPVTATAPGRAIERVSLLPARPNPARGPVVISYELPREGSVGLMVYDICGRRVRTLENSVKQAGSHSLTWKGEDQDGRMLPAGIYFYRLSAQGVELTQKLILLR